MNNLKRVLSLALSSIILVGMMAVGAYVANQFFSFGQVVSTPLIFLVIAVCENECRRKETEKGNQDGRE